MHRQIQAERDDNRKPLKCSWHCKTLHKWGDIRQNAMDWCYDTAACIANIFLSSALCQSDLLLKLPTMNGILLLQVHANFVQCYRFSWSTISNYTIWI